eukprot:sb/3461724/
MVKHKDCFYPVLKTLAVTSWAQATKTAQANLYYLQQTCPILILSTLTLMQHFRNVNLQQPHCASSRLVYADILRDSIKSPKRHPTGLYHHPVPNYSQLSDRGPLGDRTRCLSRSNATNDDLLRRPKPVIPRGASQPPAKRKNGYNSSTKTPIDLKFCMPTNLVVLHQLTCGMVLWTFYRVPKHISWSNSKFQTQLPTADSTSTIVHRKTVPNFIAFRHYFKQINLRSMTSRLSELSLAIIGDLNLSSVKDWDHPVSSNSIHEGFAHLFTSLGMSSLINAPTHRDGNVLDLILTTNSSCFSNISIEENCLVKSDHFTIKCEVQIKKRRPKFKTTKKFSYKKADWDAINEGMYRHNWTKEFKYLSAEQSLQIFKSKLDITLRHHVPLVNVKIGSQPPWYDEELRHSSNSWQSCIVLDSSSSHSSPSSSSSSSSSFSSFSSSCSWSLLRIAAVFPRSSIWRHRHMVRSPHMYGESPLGIAPGVYVTKSSIVLNIKFGTVFLWMAPKYFSAKTKKPNNPRTGWGQGLAPPGFDHLIEPDRTRPMTTSYDDLNPEPGAVENCGMSLWTFYRVPKHISWSNSKFQTQLPTADPTSTINYARLGDIDTWCDPQWGFPIHVWGSHHVSMSPNARLGGNFLPQTGVAVFSGTGWLSSLERSGCPLWSIGVGIGWWVSCIFSHLILSVMLSLILGKSWEICTLFNLPFVHCLIYLPLLRRPSGPSDPTGSGSGGFNPVSTWDLTAPCGSGALSKCQDVAFSPSNPYVLCEHFAFLPVKIDQQITELFLWLAPMTSQPKLTIADRNNPCVLLTPTEANLYYLQQTCSILLLSTLTLMSKCQDVAFSPSNPYVLCEHFAFLPVKIDQHITELFLWLAPMTSQPKLTIADRNNPCVLLTPTEANLYYLQQTCSILLLSTLTLRCEGSYLVHFPENIPITKQSLVAAFQQSINVNQICENFARFCP